MTASAAFYALGAEIVCHPWNCVAASALQVYRHCFCTEGSATRCPEGELIKDLLLPTPFRAWRGRTGSQLKTWATTSKADLEPLSGPRVFGRARWRKDWLPTSSTGLPLVCDTCEAVWAEVDPVISPRNTFPNPFFKTASRTSLPQSLVRSIRFWEKGNWRFAHSKRK